VDSSQFARWCPVPANAVLQATEVSAASASRSGSTAGPGTNSIQAEHPIDTPSRRAVVRAPRPDPRRPCSAAGLQVQLRNAAIAAGVRRRFARISSGTRTQWRCRANACRWSSSSASSGHADLRTTSVHLRRQHRDRPRRPRATRADDPRRSRPNPNPPALSLPGRTAIRCLGPRRPATPPPSQPTRAASQGRSSRRGGGAQCRLRRPVAVDPARQLWHEPTNGPGGLHSSATGVVEPDPDASYVRHRNRPVCKHRDRESTRARSAVPAQLIVRTSASMPAAFARRPAAGLAAAGGGLSLVGNGCVSSLAFPTLLHVSGAAFVGTAPHSERRSGPAVSVRRGAYSSSNSANSRAAGGA
jgi:hypothetical protein